MRRYLSASFLACFSICYAQSNGSIRGTVTFEAGSSSAHDASVHLMPLDRTAKTNDKGEYVFQNVPPGRYELETHIHYFGDQRKSVQLGSGETARVDFSLKLASLRQEVTVTASGKEENTLETFASVTSLSGQQLTTKASNGSLGEMLDNETGIAKRSFGPGTSRPVIRGFDGDRVLILSDGARTGTLSSQSGDHGEPVDPSQVERVEVVRGPATLLYGSSAIGGVVNIISAHNEMNEQPHSGLGGHLTALGGTANGLGGGSGGFEYGMGPYLLWGMGGAQRSGDYESAMGKVVNSGTRMTQSSIGFGKYGEHLFWSGSYGYQEGRYNIPLGVEGQPRPPFLEDEPVHLDWNRHNVRLHGGLRNLSGWIESFRATVNYSDWKHAEVAGDQVDTRFSNQQWTFDAVAQQKKHGVLTGSFGVWGLHRAFNSVGEEALAPPVDQNAAAVYGMEQLDFKRVKFQFGGRVEHNGYTPVGLPDRSFTGFSGAASMQVPIHDSSSFVFNYTSSYRAPALEELYNNGPHVGNLAFEIGDPNLLRERGQGYEASFRHSGHRSRLEATVFRNDMSHFVYLAPTGAIEDNLIQAMYSQADARFIGAEGRLDLLLHHDLWLNLGFDAVDAQLKATNTPLPRIPPVRGKIGFDWTHGAFGVRPELILTNRQWQIFPTETPTAGYALVNIAANYTIASKHVAHMFGVNVFNANDALYRNHLSFIKDFVPEMGRGARVSYTMTWF